MGSWVVTRGELPRLSRAVATFELVLQFKVIDLSVSIYDLANVEDGYRFAIDLRIPGKSARGCPLPHRL